MSHTTPQTRRLMIIGALLLAITAAPFAMAAGEGNPLKGGTRNPSSDASVSYASETEIIASNDTYGTRQSNKGSGGGAIYGCRAAPGAEPCLRATNLEKGRAFELATGGSEAGQITAAGGDNAKPFTTNATGVATGLNADRVDSKSAEDISKDAVGTVQAGLRYAIVGSDGNLVAGRGVASSSTGTAGDGTYTVVFSEDISKCAFSAVETQFENAGAVGIGIGADNKTVTVRTRAGGGADGSGTTDPADRSFHLTATCV